jgi:predicted lipoprotein with Yx(FWY)xxD motif
MISNLLPTRLPMVAKLGVPLAAALLAAACSSGSSSTTSTSSTSGGYGSGASASSSAGAAGGGMVITTKSGSAGTYLTDGSGRAVYLWVKDSMNKSACSGACASAWPPVTANGTVTASGGAKSSDLGSITRSGGSKQVTYDGHPLYYYVGDSGPGQTTGQGNDGFGAKWWLVAPSGAQLTGSSTSPTSPAPSKSSSTGSWA